ncbi:hypothetical protein [Jannaschia pohangensis]|uniref:Uncharacterized protein n=1 Tax=Jannaschia pohangensis TaxID=390807 RepID=A0A1I3SCK8_9RHOB|nr:hypothetical protein [Jannaschia pohangensis]SFJ56563.1 hypothetical protein SAMN04488095_3106 [Jannaschia pohangensis]
MCTLPRMPWEDDPAPATESEESTTTGAPCTEDYDAWFNVSSTGFWNTIPGHISSSNRRALPQHLKVRVDGPRSCRGDRYYFTIVERLIATAGVHWDDRGNRQGNVSKRSGSTDVLVLCNPHTAAARITVANSSHSVRTATDGSRRYAVADAEGEMT